MLRLRIVAAILVLAGILGIFVGAIWISGSELPICGSSTECGVEDIIHANDVHFAWLTLFAGCLTLGVGILCDGLDTLISKSKKQNELIVSHNEHLEKMHKVLLVSASSQTDRLLAEQNEKLDQVVKGLLAIYKQGVK